MNPDSVGLSPSGTAFTSTFSRACRRGASARMPTLSGRRLRADVDLRVRAGRRSPRLRASRLRPAHEGGVAGHRLAQAASGAHCRPRVLERCAPGAPAEDARCVRAHARARGRSARRVSGVGRRACWLRALEARVWRCVGLGTLQPLVPLDRARRRDDRAGARGAESVARNQRARLGGLTAVARRSASRLPARAGVDVVDHPPAARRARAVRRGHGDLGARLRPSLCAEQGTRPRLPRPRARARPRERASGFSRPRPTRTSAR